MRRTAAGVLCALLAAAAASPTALAVPWGPGVQAILPANAAPGVGVRIASVSCPSTGSCSAIGEYQTSSRGEGVLLTETAGVWAPGVEAMLPSEFSGGVFNAGAVSCASAGNCTAVGSFFDSANNEQGVLLSETAGTWSPGVQASLPPGAAMSPRVDLRSVSCSSPGNCSAVGSYTDLAGNGQGFMLTETGGTWRTPADELLPPPFAASNPRVFMHSVSCASPGNCSAVGGYLDNSGHQQALVVNQVGGTWSPATEITLPGFPATNPRPTLYSVSCASPGNCTAVGNYIDITGGQGLLVTETAGVWGPGTEAIAPLNAGVDPGILLDSVSCASAGYCSTVGDYVVGTTVQQGMLQNQVAGSWAPGTESSLPAGAGASPNVALASVACPVAGDCNAAGYYADSGGNTQGVLLNEAAGTWGAGVKVRPPANAGANPLVVPFSVSCATPSWCSAVGYYQDAAGNRQGLLVSTLASPSMTVSAPATGTAGRSLSSSATAALSGALSPAGTITFSVFGPQASPPTSCSSGGTLVGNATVSGNGSYQPAAPFTPRSPGDYWWYASYGGDARNSPAASACGAALAETVVGPASLSGLRVSPSTASLAGRRVSGRCVKPTRGNRHHRRCTRAVALSISYRLNSPVSVVITITQVLPGRRVGGRCVAPTRKNRRHRSCTRHVLRASLLETGKLGANLFTFGGRIGRVRLGAGNYVLTASPVTGGLSGGAQTVAFRLTA